MHLITTLEQLTALFGEVGEASLKKEVAHIHPHYQALIKASPFAILATCGPDGLDASPRGDPPGFVMVQDPHTLLMPERRGNNRIDSLRNLLLDDRVALLFLIPGLGETLRVMGRATISVDPALLRRFEVQGQRPKCVLIIRVESAFFQCARAIKRSRLWAPATTGQATPVPSAGTMLAALSDSEIDGEQYDRDLPARQDSTLY
ncbi:pyridoxamine 5'-phosphate oxidase family protein [Aquabacterium sp.]|uniref:pyridoxamine 5'-phosphate oxidase family protein n=1 Tax=Aquabacterium sp. TaxID=1872578 RepID=UPI003D6D79D9